MKTITTWTLERCASLAKNMTEESANIADWKLITNKDRELKALAVTLAENKGYIIATPKELNEMYPALFSAKLLGTSQDDEKFVWGVSASPKSINDRKHLSLQFCPIH